MAIFTAIGLGGLIGGLGTFLGTIGPIGTAMLATSFEEFDPEAGR